MYFFVSLIQAMIKVFGKKMKINDNFNLSLKLNQFI